MTLIDLKVLFPECHTPASIKQETAYELKENDIFTGVGVGPKQPIDIYRLMFQK